MMQVASLMEILMIDIYSTLDSAALFTFASVGSLSGRKNIVKQQGLMAEHLASIFGTEKDRVNCPFYFKIDHIVGNVYVQFREEDQAAAALRALQGQFYSGRPIIVDFSPITDFREATCRQFEENSCNRGGYCNFMHVKKIGRSLRKKLYGHYRRSRSSRSRSRSRSPDPYYRKSRSYSRDRDRDYDYKDSGRRSSDRDSYRRHLGSPRRTMSPVREESEERRARIEQRNREQEVK